MHKPESKKENARKKIIRWAIQQIFDSLIKILHLLLCWMQVILWWFTIRKNDGE
jgi:cell division septal protein FtsQ